MNAADIFLTIIVVAMVAAAVYVLWKTGRAGKTSCGCDKDCGCGGCSGGNCSKCKR